MQADWRLIVFQLTNFAILMALLARFLFRPMRALVERRAAALEAEHREAEARRAAAEARRTEYEGKLAALDAENAERRRRIEADALAAAELVRAGARAEAEAARRRSEADCERARAASVEAHARDLRAAAAAGAAAILRTTGGPTLVERYAELGVEQLYRDLAPGAAGEILVEVSPDGDLARIEHLVRAPLPPTAIVELRHASTVLGGVRITAGNLQVDASAGADLDRWQAGGATTTAAPEEAARE